MHNQVKPEGTHRVLAIPLILLVDTSRGLEIMASKVYQKVGLVRHHVDCLCI